MTPAAKLRAQIALRSERPFGAPSFRVSDDVAERVFMERLTGGYTKRRNPTCTACGVMKSVSGSCYC